MVQDGGLGISGIKCQIFNPAKQLLDSNSKLCSSQEMADAVMDAAPESKVVSDTLALQVDFVGILIFDGIVIGRQIADHNNRILGNINAGELDILHDQSIYVRARGMLPQNFFDKYRNLAVILLKRHP